jgi:hypothetical protein
MSLATQELGALTMDQDLDIGMFYVYRWIARYEYHLSEKLRDAVMVQQTVLNKAQSEYDHIFSLGSRKKGGGKSKLQICQTLPCKGVDLVK